MALTIAFLLVLGLISATMTTTRKEFKKMLEDHDWYYQMSSSSVVYERGLASKNKIDKLLKENPKWQSLYDKAKPANA